VAAGVAMGVLFGGLGQVGDLSASLLKRDAGVKDAGRALPGFGGILDLIDSPILVAPVAFWLLHSVGV
jgi:phosphatidate cytidylyltransferase